MTALPLERLTGIAAPLMRDNVDTDAIIPSRETQSVVRSGYGEKLFANWRYEPGTRIEQPDFILNRAPFRHAEILLSGRNFGCGSSREAAAWSLAQFGIRCVIAASYGAIFRNNCIRNGVVPVALPLDEIETLVGEVETDPNQSVTVDLVTMQVISPCGRAFAFALKGRERELLIKGLNEIEATEQYADEIDAFLARDRERRRWAYDPVAG